MMQKQARARKKNKEETKQAVTEAKTQQGVIDVFQDV